MKTLATDAMTAIEAGEVIVTGAVEITPRDDGTPLRLWGGYGPIEFGGNTYQGLGDRALVQRTSNAFAGFFPPQ